MFHDTKMESQTLKTSFRARHRVSMSPRAWIHPTKAFHLVVMLSCMFVSPATCMPCSTNGFANPEANDACGSYRNNYNVGFQDIYVGVSDTDSRSRLNLEDICTNSGMFCFPSTLPGFISEDHKFQEGGLEVSGSPKPSKSAGNSSWSSDYGMFKLLNGRVVSCSLESIEDTHESRGIQSTLSSCRRPSSNKISETNKPGFVDGSSPHVVISPPLLDWGEKYLYFPSIAYLTVENTCNESVLRVYEPYSTNGQFYPCNFSEVLLVGPHEVASICFIFLPRSLGLSSAHLILQTSSGGFLVQAKGYAIESPYRTRPLVGVDVSSNGRWIKNLSLFNPFDETLYLEEVTAWISLFLGNTSHSAEAVCTIDTSKDSSNEFILLNFKESLDVKSAQSGSPLMSIRPNRIWEIDPRSTETIIEIDFSSEFEGRVVGSLCMQLLRSSQDKTDVIMVPLEAELGGKAAAYDAAKSSVTVSFEAVAPCATETVVVSLRNVESYLLSVVSISEVTESVKIFRIKYVGGLILFPGLVTQVAVVTFDPLLVELYASLKDSDVKLNCTLFILTNDSRCPPIEIQCQDILHTCSRRQLDSRIGYEHQSAMIESENTRTGSFVGSMQSQKHIKSMEVAEADELVLGNWKSQGTITGLTVLDDNEILFPTVQVGTFHSKRITVKNPSEHPVIMQLILNSGEIIDGCKIRDVISLPPENSDMPTRFGFSVAENAITEAFVHPNGSASFGPILFHPSNPCRWRSSALVRNNLSGVEWLSLHGFGGSLSLSLLEGSQHVQSLKFNLNVPIPLNISSAATLFHCSRPLSKELYAKNTGDLPLEVRRIGVSGNECGSDGFTVHTCQGFSLEPGESAKLLISYQTDFSAAIIQRDLELTLGTGIFVMPMKASLSTYMVDLCKKSAFWIRVKKFVKFFMAVLFVVLFMFLAFSCMLPQVLPIGSNENLFKREKNSIATIRHAGKSSRVHRNQKNSKLSMPTKMDSLLGAVGDDESETLMLGSFGRYPDGPGGSSQQVITAQQVKQMPGNSKLGNGFFADTSKERTLPASLLSKTLKIENSDLQESSEHGNLTVRIGKEKGRRRRKRRNGGAVLSGLFEVSSSQSGNSTPSSPLSPITSFTPRRAWSASPEMDQSIDARNPFEEMPDPQFQNGQSFQLNSQTSSVSETKKNTGDNWFSTQEQPSVPIKRVGKAVLLPSATFPSTRKPAPSVLCPPSLLVPTSTIAPHARAPGSKLYDQKKVEAEKKPGLGGGDDFTYDIWGDHFSGLYLMGKPKEASGMVSTATAKDSDSFFVRGPQTLVSKSQARSVSFFHQEG